MGGARGMLKWWGGGGGTHWGWGWNEVRVLVEDHVGGGGRK